MRIYEELFIVRAETTEEELDPIIEQIKGIVTASGGTLDKTEKWGIRKLAYRIAKQAEGQYVLLQFTAKADTVRELERRLRVNDAVIKFLTVRIDEKLKRIEKRKKAREKRALRKPPPSPVTPAAASPLIPSEAPPPIPGAPGAATPSGITPGAAAPEPPVATE